MDNNPRILQETKDYTTVYHQAIKFAETQADIFWHPNEVPVEKDIQDMRVNLTEAEYHGVVTVLRLFTTYELFAGADYWADRVMKDFPRPDIQRMANAFSYFELNVHAPFYDKINQLLGLSTPEFYLGYVDDPVLSERMDFIDSYVNHEDKLTSLAVFSMVEGVILYSSFAFLKHFQAQGKNKIVNINSGISFSVRDENLHAQGGAWLYQTLKQEMNLDNRSVKPLEARILSAARTIYEHECQIVDMIFEKGSITGTTPLQLKNFIMSRIDICLVNLGMEPIYKVEYNPIANWFYTSINGGGLHDFFFALGSEYNRDWSEKKLAWVPFAARQADKSLRLDIDAIIYDMKD